MASDRVKSFSNADIDVVMTDLNTFLGRQTVSGKIFTREIKFYQLVFDGTNYVVSIVYQEKQQG